MMCQALNQTKQWTKQFLFSSNLHSGTADNNKEYLIFQVVINVLKKNKVGERRGSGRRDAIFYKMLYYIPITSLFNQSSVNEHLAYI